MVLFDERRKREHFRAPGVILALVLVASLILSDVGISFAITKNHDSAVCSSSGQVCRISSGNADQGASDPGISARNLLDSSSTDTLSDAIRKYEEELKDDKYKITVDGITGTLWEVYRLDETNPTELHMKQALAEMLLKHIEKILKVEISTLEFQNAFFDLINLYEYLDSPNIGVSSNTSILVRDNTNRDVQRYSDLLSLYQYASDAMKVIYDVSNIAVSEANLSDFFERMVGDDYVSETTGLGSVKKVLERYTSKFDKMLQNSMFTDCLLGGDSTNKEKNKYYLLTTFATSYTPDYFTIFHNIFGFTKSGSATELLPHLNYKDIYDNLQRTYEVEAAYKNLGYTPLSKTDANGTTNSMRVKMATYLEATAEKGGLYTVYQKLSGSVLSGGLGSSSEADSFIRRQLYGSDILEMITEYTEMTSFFTSLDALPGSVTTKEDVNKCSEAYNKYKNLSTYEKNKLSESDYNKIGICEPVISVIDSVVSKIDSITYPKNESEYRNTFLKNVQTVETAYNELLTKYPNAEIETFIGNRAKLTTEYKTYQGYQDRLFDALAISDSEVCGKLSTVIEPLKKELDKLSTSNSTIFNKLIGYSTLVTRYNDAVVAKKLRDRVDVLLTQPTLYDKTELNNVSKEANALNQQAKNFFGALYFSYIKALSDGSIVEDQNLASRVDTLIERIGTVTLSSGDRIIAAEDAYAALSDVQKSLVKNYEKLTSARKDYDNLRMDISSASVTGIKTGYVYTRSAICPVPKVVVNKKVLKSGTDYELSYSNNKNVGTATVTITAKDGSGYRGAFIKNFNIVKDSIGDGSLTGIKKKYKYTGSKIRPVPTLRVNGKKLKKGTDYKVSYSRNKKVGVASVTLKGIGNYKGSKTKTFNIIKASRRKSARPSVRILSDATLSELQAAVTAYQSRLTAHAISTDFSSYTTEAEMIDAMKKALARMLIYDISNQLGMVIISSEFQNSFYTLIEEYDKLLSLGVVSYAATSDIDPNGYLSCYSDLTTMYSYLKTSLIRIYNASQMSLSANNLVTFYSSVYEGDDSVYLAVSKYRDKYTEMASKDKFKKCLLDNDTTNLEYYMYYMLSDFPLNSAYLSAYGFDGVATGDYYEMYEKLMLRYMLEKSYSNLSYTPSDNTSMRSNFSKFEENGNSYTVPGMYVLYTRLCGYDKIWSQADVYGLGSRTAAESFIKSQLYGSDILQIIREYEDIKSFLVELDSLSSSAGQGSSSDVKKAVDVYTKYTKLTESEKSKLSANDITLLNACKPVMSKIDDVVTKIKSITYPTTQAIYKSTFLVKYQAALSAYEALLKLYPNSGIEVFVENRLKLTDEYKTYKTYQDKINDALAIDPVNVCFKLKTVIEPLKVELEKLSVSNTTVFNRLIDYNKFTALHTDATAASALRLRVDALMLSPSSEDSAEITSIRSAVNALNANAKKYFGTLYDQYLQALEYGTYTEDINRSSQVDSLISKIGTVNINSGPSIIEAEEAYDALTTMQKSLVKTYATLVAARQTYNSLRLSLSAASVSGIKTGYVYTHARIKPGPVVVLEGVTLKAGVDYTISYSNNKNVGTATVTLTAVDGSGYKGEYHKTFKIVKDSVKDCGISGMKASYKYTGKKVKPKPVVRVNGYKLKKGTDYKLVYSNNKNNGIATLKIKGIGNYKGSRIITFNIKK